MAPKVLIRKLTHHEDFDRLLPIQRAVWGHSETDLTPAHQFCVHSRMGAILLGAFVDGTLAGFVYSFPALHRRHPHPAFPPPGRPSRVPGNGDRQEAQEGPAARSPEAGRRPHHLDLRSDAGEEREPQPAFPAGPEPDLLPQLLRERIVALPWAGPAHGPSARGVADTRRREARQGPACRADRRTPCGPGTQEGRESTDSLSRCVRSSA